jgi:hypothetical protein
MSRKLYFEAGGNVAISVAGRKDRLVSASSPW